MPLGGLSVEDSANDARLMVRALADAGYEVAWERVETEATMRAALAARAWDVIVADYNLPDCNGLACRESDATLAAERAAPSHRPPATLPSA